MRSSRKTAAVGRVVLALALCQIASGQTVRPASRAEFTRRLVAAAIERTHHRVRYVSEYLRIPYPGGDVPADTGVCTDEIIRSYRAVRVDLQKEVHEDMVRNFAAYPNQRRWLLAHPDSNIDHRRVPNLMVFFQRKGETLPITARSQDYAPGISSPGIWDETCRILELLWIRSRVGVDGTWSSTTLARDRRWRTRCSTGRSRDTIDISARVSLMWGQPPLRQAQGKALGCPAGRSPAAACGRRRTHDLAGFGTTFLNSSDLPRGIVSVFHSLDRKCFARNTICPICAA